MGEGVEGSREGGYRILESDALFALAAAQALDDRAAASRLLELAMELSTACGASARTARIDDLLRELTAAPA